MSKFDRGPSIDASYQVSVHLGKQFQRKIFFRNQPIRNKNCLCRTSLQSDRKEMRKIYRGPSIDAAYQILVHLAKRFQRKRLFSNQPIRNKNCLWRPCLLTDRDEISNLYRGSYIDAYYQVLVNLAMQFQRRFFRNQPIRNMNCLWRPCLLTDQDKMSKVYRGPSMDASYHVSVHLTKWFHRRSFFKSSNQKQELPVMAIFVNGSTQNEQSL
jgi:hypothetical protein